MEITFLGTGAAEQYPGVWCTCDYCSKARKLGGRNIRRPSSAHFAQNCMLDFPAEVFSQAEMYGIDLIPTELLLMTHSHADHFFPQQLIWRYRPEEAEKMSDEERASIGCSRHQNLPTLHVYGNRMVFSKLEETLNGNAMADLAMDFTIPQMYIEYHCAGVSFIPMTASHMDGDREHGIIYIVETEGKTFLYASDSGTYNKKTRECIAAHKFDAIIMEQTAGFGGKGPNLNHMTWQQAMDEAKFFQEAGVWKNEPRIYWTHMSPHRTPPQVDLEEMLKGTAIIPAYDGLRIEL